MAPTAECPNPDDAAAKWQVLDRRTVYSSWWVELHIDSVRLNDGRVIEHEVVVSPQDAAGMVVVNDQHELLMIYRHRFIPDTWAWELPAGLVDPGESPEEGAVRECLEETGHHVADVEPLTAWFPSSGFSNQRFHAFLARSVVDVNEPTELNEAISIEWRPAEVVAEELLAGNIPDGFAQVALMRAFAQLGWVLHGGGLDTRQVRQQAKVES